MRTDNKETKKTEVFTSEDLNSGNLSYEAIIARNKRIEDNKETAFRKNRGDDDPPSRDRNA